jgi:uncharacterized membrane protein
MNNFISRESLKTLIQNLNKIGNSISSLIAKDPRFIVIILTGVNLAIALFLAANLNLWIDEAFSLHTTGKDLGYALNQAIHFELQPPLYFLILNLWRTLDNSIFFARLFSVLCVVTTIPIVARLSQKFLPEIHPGWVTTAVALNPFTIWAAVEIRLYAFAILLSALLLLFFFNGYLSDVPNHKARWGYVLVSILSLYTQYFLGFLLVATGCTLLILKRWQAFRHYIMGMTIVGIACTPIFLLVQNQVSSHSAAILTDSFFTALKRIAWIITRFILHTEWTPLGKYGGKSVYIILGILIFLLVQFYRNRRLIQINYIALWIITLVPSLLIFGVVLKVTGTELLTERHAVVIFIPLMLSIFPLIKVGVCPLVQKKNQSKILFTWTLIILFFNLTYLYITYQPMHKLGDSNQVASYIMASEKPNQPILTFPAYVAIPVSYYYSGKNTIVPLPKAEDFKEYDLRQYSLTNEKEILSALSRVTGEHQYIWLIRDGGDTFCSLFGFDLNCEILNKFVDKHYLVESHQDFYGTSVRLLRRRRPLGTKTSRLHLNTLEEMQV